MIYAKGYGRFGNQFFRNMYAWFISEKWNMGCELESPDLFGKIGIPLKNKKGDIFSMTKAMNENDLLYYLEEAPNFNITLGNIYCQTEKFASYLRENFPFYSDVWNANPFKDRYNNNDDVFVHCRIGDLEKLGFLLPYEYYDKALSSTIHQISNEAGRMEGGRRKGYISSDSPNHRYVQDLMAKYDLELYKGDPFKTLLFGSTCKTLVLSQGTFSWLMGFLSQNEVVCVNPEQVRYWHGSIFQAFRDKWTFINMGEPVYFKSAMHRNDYTFPKDTVFFIHAPKTGGTSIGEMSFPHISHYLHQPISYNAPIEAGYRYFTVFRNPIERVWSHYHMLKSRQRTLDRFLGYWEGSNLMTRYLAGYADNVIVPDEVLLRKAKEAMGKLTFIIDFAFLEAELNQFLAYLGLSLHEPKPMVHARKGPKRPEMTVVEWKKINQANQMDIELYKEFVRNKGKYQPRPESN